MFLRFGCVFLWRKSGNDEMGSKSGIFDYFENILTPSKFLRDLSYVFGVIFHLNLLIKDVWKFKYWLKSGFEKVEWWLFVTWYFKIHTISFCLGSWRCSWTCMDSKIMIGGVYKIGFRFILGKGTFPWDFWLCHFEGLRMVTKSD